MLTEFPDRPLLQSELDDLGDDIEEVQPVVLQMHDAVPSDESNDHVVALRVLHAEFIAEYAFGDDGWQEVQRADRADLDAEDVEQFLDVTVTYL